MDGGVVTLFPKFSVVIVSLVMIEMILGVYTGKHLKLQWWCVYFK